MDRAFVHMTTGLPDHCECEGRKYVDTFLHIDMEAAMSSGLIFYKSGNGVILTRDVPWRFVKQVTNYWGKPIMRIEGRDGAPRQTIPGSIPVQPWSQRTITLQPQSQLGRPAEATSPVPSRYNQTEKNFLKACKLVRDILKLESQKDLKNQLDKVASKPEALKELCTMLDHVAEDSYLRQKNEDVIEIVRAHQYA